jgi:hypothetical protein
MRRTIIAVLALAGCSSERVQPIGLHQYVVTAEGKQLYAKANETCAKLGRTMVPLPMPPPNSANPRQQLKFECMSPFEIVPVDQHSYRVWVPTSTYLELPANAEMLHPPDEAVADRYAKQRASVYCAQMNKTMNVTGGGFDMGTGLTVIFKCVSPQPGAVNR